MGISDKKSRNEISGLFNRKTVEGYIRKHIEEASGENFCTMFLAAFDDFDKLALESPDACEQVIRYAGRTLPTLFRATDVIGHVEDNLFLMFLSGCVTERSVAEKANAICRKMQFAVQEQGAFTFDITVCVGVYVISEEETTYERLYAGAKEALKEAQKKGLGGSYHIIKEVSSARDRQYAELLEPVSAVQLHTLLEYMDGSICLLEVGEEIRLLYASPGFYQMMDLTTDALVLPCSIRKIGIHPDYEAEYVRKLREGARDRKVVSHAHRIADQEGKRKWRQVRAVVISDEEKEPPIMLEVSTDISELMEKARLLRESNERLRVAFGQTPNVLWEVDIREKRFAMYDVNRYSYDDRTIVEHFPEAFLKKALVHADSEKHFLAFAHELLGGNAAGSGNFIMRNPEKDSYEWVTLSYRMSYDEEGKPLKAIGIQEKLPDVSGLHRGFFPRRPLPEILRHRMLARTQINLSKDTVDYLWIEGTDKTAWTLGRTYEEILTEEKGRLFIQGEQDHFEERFSREHLLAAYRNGKRWSTEEYFRICPNGTIRWTTDMFNLQKNEEAGDVYMFACFSDSQQRKSWEEHLPEEIDRRKKNGLYSLETMMELSNHVAAMLENEQCAMSCISVIGLDEISEHGVSWKKDVWDFICTALSYVLGVDVIAGQYREDTLAVFFPKAESKYDVKRRIEDSFAYIRTTMADLPGIDRIRLVAGVVLKQTEEAGCEIMCMQADYLSDLWKNSAMDDVVMFSEEDEDWEWIYEMQNSQKFAYQVSDPAEGISREIQSEVLACVTAMLGADSLEKSMQNALRRIGTYYQADRVYMVALAEDRQKISVPREWLRGGKYSIRQVMSGMQTQKIPVIQRCIREQKPLFMKSSRTAGTGMGSGETWHFIVYPMRRQEDMGFLCVENARNHFEEKGFLDMVIPYMEIEHKRFRRISSMGETATDEMLQYLPNLRDYMDMVYSMNSGVYSSMGAVALDIPNYSALNSQYGFSYGKDLLVFILETLRELFGKNFIFRTWDAEFVVLFPNTIREVFTGRCTRLRAMIQRRYPGQVRIGYTWSSGVFSADHLVEEAKAIMKCEEVREAPPNHLGLLERNWSYGINRALKKSYTLYLQPRVDMRTGRAVGAEALVRGIDDKGNMIPPAQFIETLEKSGEIRDLDFYMLESVLHQLDLWRERGYDPIKVSVNISRVTLLNPTIFASVLAIYSHYPLVRPERVELEITETANDIEKTTLEEIVERFEAAGIGFELDDFGSRYANVSIFSNVKFRAIKLDRSLIHDLPTNEISRMLVENIVEICKNVGMDCVAEGVETRKQEEVLLKAGCVWGQGYYYARPMPVWKFEEEYLNRDKPGEEELSNEERA